MFEVEFDDFDIPEKEPSELEALNARIEALAGGEVLRVEGLSSDLYRAALGVSTTQIKTFIDCPYRYWAQYVEKSVTFENKPYFAFGRAGHTAVLEPEKFNLEYVRQPDDIKTRAGAKWEYFNKRSGDEGKEVLTAEFYDAMPKLQKAIDANKWGKILTTGGVAEVSYFMRDVETNMIIKCRPDYEIRTPGGLIISDLKTSESVKPSKINRKFKDLGYHVQDALYSYIVQPAQFVFVAIESKAPYIVTAPIEFDESVKRLGYLQFRKALKELRSCMKSNIWPMYTDKKHVIAASDYDNYLIEKLENEQ